MSDHTIERPQPEQLSGGVGLIGNLLLLVGLVCLALSIATPFVDETLQKQFAHSYLLAFMYFFTIAAGAFFWVILHHACDSNWTVLVRRQFENIGAVFPLLALLSVPVFLFAPELWKWMLPKYQTAGYDVLYDEKAGYLNHAFFAIRVIFYFVFFIFATAWFRQRSVAQDFDGHPMHSWKMRVNSFASIALFAVCLTFAAIDWLMGLDFHWYSTMWGVYIFAGSAQSAMALTIIIVLLLKSAGYLKAVTSEHAHIMGKLLFAFTVFWAYIGFSQYMLIWYANLPEETIWYMQRNQGTWEYVSIFLVAGHFVFPFILLLSQAMKQSFVALSLISCWILFVHFVDLYWIILPRVHHEGVVLHYLDITCWIGFAGLFGYVLMSAIRGVPLFPSRDPRLLNCLRLTN